MLHSVMTLFASLLKKTFFFFAVLIIVFLVFMGIWEYYYDFKFKSIDLGDSRSDVVDVLGPADWIYRDKQFPEEVFEDYDGKHINEIGLWSATIMVNVYYYIAFDRAGKVVDTLAIPQ